MPKFTKKYATAEEIPAEYKQFVLADGLTVEVWYGDNVAGETNPALETKRKELLDKLVPLQQKYDTLLTSSAETATALREAQVALANNVGATPEDLQLVQTIKAIDPAATPESVKATLTEYPTLKQNHAQLVQQQENLKIFKASGYTNETVFNMVASNPALNPNLEKLIVETVDGKDKVYANVKDANGAISKQPLEEYAKANPNWVAVQSSLTQGQQQNNWFQQNSSDPTQQNPQGGNAILSAFVGAKNAQNANAGTAMMPKPEPPK